MSSFSFLSKKLFIPLSIYSFKYSSEILDSSSHISSSDSSIQI